MTEQKREKKGRRDDPARGGALRGKVGRRKQKGRPIAQTGGTEPEPGTTAGGSSGFTPPQDDRENRRR